MRRATLALLFMALSASSTMNLSAQQTGALTILLANETGRSLKLYIARSQDRLFSSINKIEMPAASADEFSCDSDDFCLVGYKDQGKVRIVRTHTENKYVFRIAEGKVRLFFAGQ